MSWLVFAEILPIHIRSTAFPLGLSVMWLANFAPTSANSAIREGPLGNHGSMWFFATISIAGVVYVSVMVPETKDKSPEEVARHFTGCPDINSTVADAIRKQSDMFHYFMPDIEPNKKNEEQIQSTAIRIGDAEKDI